MILKTTLKDLNEFIYKYNDLLGWADGCEVEDSKSTHLGISNCRIQIPSLDISLREGELMSQSGGEYYESYDSQTGEHIIVDNPPTEDAEWEVDASCVIICELNEKDMQKYLGWTTSDFQGAVYDYFYPKYSYSDLDDVPCIIDTSDFMEDEKKAQKYAKECEDAYEEENEEC